MSLRPPSHGVFWQYVVLGADWIPLHGENPFSDAGLKVFEVDFPATQHWKRQRLANAGMGEPASLTFAPVDFESQTLADGLRVQPDSGRISQHIFRGWA